VPLAAVKLVLLGGVLLAGEGVSQGVAGDTHVRDTVLSNGLTVLAARNPVIPVATIEIAFRNGAFTQLEPEHEGLPHLMEHMFFKSFDRGDVSSRAADLDAWINGTTGVETVTYYYILPARNLKKGIERLSDAVRSPRFPKNDLAEEKQRVSNELERSASDPFFLLDFHTDAALWRAAFRQKNVGGNLPAVLGATSEALEEHYKRFYAPNNAAVVVTGDIDPEEVFEVAAKSFGSWERRPDPFEGFSHPPVRPLPRDTVVVVEANAPDVTLVVAWHGPSQSDDPEGAVAADLFSEIVTQRVSGAYRRLVDSGLFHFLSFSYENSNHVGPIKLVARTIPERAAIASSALRNEIELMGSDDYFTADELEMARTSLSVRAAFERESAISRAHRLAREWSLSGTEGLVQPVMSVLEHGLDAVRQYVSRYIKDRPRTLALLVSSSTIDTHTDALIACLEAWERR